MHFEVFQREDGQWQWRAVGANGEVFNDGYRDSTDARRGVQDFVEAMIASMFGDFSDAPVEAAGPTVVVIPPD